MAKLLVDESPLQLLPTLACKIGLPESIILQQIHYWVEINKEANRNLYDGYYWTYNSYSEWHKQFPFWTERNVKRIFRELEKKGILVSGNYNKWNLDRTKWYRINYEVLESAINSPKGNCFPTKGKNFPHDETLLSPPIPETTSETTTDTTLYKGILPSGENTSRSFSFPDFVDEYEYLVEDEVVETVNLYLKEYKRTQGKDHPRLKMDQWERVIENIMYCSVIQENLSVDEVEKMIDKHFITEYRDCDYNILHFISDDVYNNRFYEEVYGLA
ncbi:MAG TPA: replication protein [Pelotomaculum sp.]|nr:replication protein [Pelotomaculum sp.]